ncbi:uncharacterized protein Dana_GF18068 [Drosophila ananassae]|uniref:Bomanin bicipital 3 n=1 Tax=Drosophila ananassae TaxID=7217 RepID=B3LVL9_DROAN|nr:uncharacterized protein LOC6500847 [Drosophila ananassae]EDV42589.2 uncharacterized protein Dana_GF18068 [Drosophila ananassae]
MQCLTCVLFSMALIPALISGLPNPNPNPQPSTVVVNGVCLTCPNPHGDPVYLDGQEYRSFSSPNSNGNVVISRGGGEGYGGGRGTIYRRGGNTIVNGRCEHCNVDI